MQQPELKFSDKLAQKRTDLAAERTPIAGRPAISAMAFPGSRVELIRACTMATVLPD